MGLSYDPHSALDGNFGTSAVDGSDLDGVESTRESEFSQVSRIDSVPGSNIRISAPIVQEFNADNLIRGSRGRAEKKRKINRLKPDIKSIDDALLLLTCGSLQTLWLRELVNLRSAVMQKS